MRHHRATLAVIIPFTALALVLARPSNSLAEGKARDPYEETISIAVAEFEHGNFAEAREQFARAHAMQPTARTFRALGLVNFELRNYVEAATMLEQALSSAVKPLSSQHRSETAKLLERTRTYLGTVLLDVDPSTADITVDGASVQLDASRTLLLAVGEHSFEVTAEGRLPVRQTLSIKGGQSETLHITLQPVPDPHAVAAAADPDPAPSRPEHGSPQRVDTPLYKKWWLWTAAGVVLAAAATTTAILLTRDTSTHLEPAQSPNTPPGATIQTLQLAGGQP
ncbi:MAG: tetratricopeptide repeat protein [Myxococcales bacterium]